jgi:glycerol-3-phosphate dehydrogenase
VPTTRAAVELARRFGLHLPIVEAMGTLIRGEMTAREALRHLMQLPQRHELSTPFRGPLSGAL